MTTRNSKVIRLNFKNSQYIEDVRELFAKVKFYKDVYWDDNRILTMALANLIWDFRTYISEDQKEKAWNDMEKTTK